MPLPHGSLYRRLAPWVAAALLCTAAALARDFLIQPPEVAHRCASDTLTLAVTGPWWCGVRAAIIMTYAWNALLYGAALATVVALVVRRAWTGWIALAIGLLAIVWYTYEAGAVAITIGALVLARAQVGDGPPAVRG